MDEIKELDQMTALCDLLSSIGVLYELNEGQPDKSGVKQCYVSILDSQGVQPMVGIYFNVDRDGNQYFVCQD
jgi:hypothetical protein